MYSMNPTTATGGWAETPKRYSRLNSERKFRFPHGMHFLSKSARVQLRSSGQIAKPRYLYAEIVYEGSTDLLDEADVRLFLFTLSL